jgi:hypothetical protein
VSRMRCSASAYTTAFMISARGGNAVKLAQTA